MDFFVVCVLYVQDESEEEKSDILTPLRRGHNRHAGEEGRAVREKFLLYFNEEGKYHGKTGLSAKC